jgi:hypothetical protein
MRINLANMGNGEKKENINPESKSTGFGSLFAPPLFEVRKEESEDLEDDEDFKLARTVFDSHEDDKNIERHIIMGNTSDSPKDDRVSAETLNGWYVHHLLCPYPDYTEIESLVEMINSTRRALSLSGVGLYTAKDALRYLGNKIFKCDGNYFLEDLQGNGIPPITSHSFLGFEELEKIFYGVLPRTSSHYRMGAKEFFQYNWLRFLEHFKRDEFKQQCSAIVTLNSKFRGRHRIERYMRTRLFLTPYSTLDLA